MAWHGTVQPEHEHERELVPPTSRTGGEGAYSAPKPSRNSQQSEKHTYGTEMGRWASYIRAHIVRTHSEGLTKALAPKTK